MDVSSTMLSVLVLGYLRRYCQGRAAARTQDRITSDLRDLGLDVTVRTVRDAASALVLAGWPIGTAAGVPAGCFLCGTREDFLAARHNLTTRLRCQAARVRRFDETAQAALSGQECFNFDEADNLYHEIEAAPLLALAGRGMR